MARWPPPAKGAPEPSPRPAPILPSLPVTLELPTPEPTPAPHVGEDSDGKDEPRRYLPRVVMTAAGLFGGAFLGAFAGAFGWGMGWVLTGLTSSLTFTLLIAAIPAYRLVVDGVRWATHTSRTRWIDEGKLTNEATEWLTSLLVGISYYIGLFYSCLGEPFLLGLPYWVAAGTFAGVCFGSFLPQCFVRAWFNSGSVPIPSDAKTPTPSGTDFRPEPAALTVGCALLGLALVGVAILNSVDGGGWIGFALTLGVGMLISLFVVGTVMTCREAYQQTVWPGAVATTVGLIAVWVVGIHETFAFYNSEVCNTATGVTYQMRQSIKEGHNRQRRREDLPTGSRHFLTIADGRPFRWLQDDNVTAVRTGALVLVDLADGKLPRYVPNPNHPIALIVAVSLRLDNPVVSAATDRLLEELSGELNQAAARERERCYSETWTYQLGTWLSQRRAGYLRSQWQ